MVGRLEIPNRVKEKGVYVAMGMMFVGTLDSACAVYGFC